MEIPLLLKISDWGTEIFYKMLGFPSAVIRDYVPFDAQKWAVSDVKACRHLLPFPGEFCAEGSESLGIWVLSSFSCRLLPMGREGSVIHCVEDGFPRPCWPSCSRKVKLELCNGFSLCLSWDLSSAPILYTASFLQRAIPYSSWAWSQKHWDDEKSQKRVALILVGLGKSLVEIRENKPPKQIKRKMKKL